MGVTGLWQLLDPTGKPVRLEALEGKVLAIDISIWLNQLIKGYRKADGSELENSHLVGLFQRVCKLLHYKIKPVFVFDGEPPALKYQTLATRKRRKTDGDEAIRSATKRLLETYVQQKLIGDSNAKLPKLKPSRRHKEEEELFKLPEMSGDLSGSDEDSYSDTDMVQDDVDLSSIRIDSDGFKSLPVEMQHELLIAIKDREKKGMVMVDELPTDGNDFSFFQMNQVLKRRKIQARIEEAQMKMNDGFLRVASDPNVKVLLKLSPMKKSTDINQPDEATASKLLKLELPTQESAEIKEETKEKKVENFLVSQWLQGAQQGDECNETLKKAVQLVGINGEIHDETDSGASSEEPPKVDRVPFRGGKVSAEDVLKLKAMVKSMAQQSVAPSDASVDSVLSDGLSMEVGHGSILSASTSRLMLPDEQFDEGSNPKRRSSDDISKHDVDNEDTTEPTCTTDVLNADLEISETGNSLFRVSENNTKATKSVSEENSASSCKLTEVKGSPVIKEVSFMGGTQSSLNSNDDIVLPQNLSRYASKDPSRCNSSSAGFVPEASSTSTEPTDFHQALEIIKEQERRQSECTADDEEVMGDDDVDMKAINKPQEVTSKCYGIVEDIVQESAELQREGCMKQKTQDDVPTTSLAPGLGKEGSAPRQVRWAPDSEEVQSLAVQSQALQNEINRLERQSKEVTSIMAGECEELLNMFGLPFVRAPREAEAQCAALENLGLVHGVVTDDSDIFLFGGKTVYKNFFSQDHLCEVFSSKLIESRLKLSKEDMIGFAMLTGSDYTHGIENVGPVTACEILAEFRVDRDPLKALRDFKQWWTQAQKGSVPPKNSIRTRFIRLALDEKFPNDVVFNAYLRPTVDSSPPKFSWVRPDLDLLRSFALLKFKWNQEKTDSYLLPILKRFEDRSLQPRIDGFLLPSCQKKENLFPSKRLKAAVSKIKAVKEANLSESSSDENE